MTYAEIEAILNKVVESPDLVSAEAPGLLDSMKETFSEIDALKADSAKKDEKIRDLQDANTKLFLSVTGQKQEEDDEDKEITMDEFIANI